jgi:hypothetical protein
MLRSSPILTEVAWSKGRYDSYVLHPDGSMIGTVHPPGLAWRVNDNQLTIPDEMTFLSSRNQRCRGRWFVAALLPCPFKRLKTGSSYLCQLILVMGAKATVGKKSLMNREVKIYYYKMRGDLSDSAIPTIFNSNPSPKCFVTNLFESSISEGSEKTTRRMRLLNQISGPMLAGWKLEDSTTVVDGHTYHQCRLGPDQWLNRAPIYKDSELGIHLTNPKYSLWQPHPQHLRVKCNDDVSLISGTKTTTQFIGSDVLVAYTTRKKSYGRYMWMPLPKSPLGHRDFALITSDQKADIDNMFTEEEECLMEPQEFRNMVIEMTIDNGFDSFVRLLILSCGKSYFGKKCMMFVVSIISDNEMELLRAKKSSIKIDDDREKLFEILETNIQDPHIAGTVVFRGNVFSTICQFGKEEIALVMSAYPTSFERSRTSNQGTFHMTQERQSNMASRNMGVCGNSLSHHYYNDTRTNTCLVPFTSPLMNMLNFATIQVQDSSGQVLIGLIKMAYKTLRNWSNIRSDDVCPYGIVTCPRHDKKKGVLESFSNCGHRDSTDCTDEDQGRIVFSYLEQMKNNTLVLDYLKNMYSSFSDVLVSPIIPLPTTCAWKLIEDPDEYNYKHISYFVVVDAGIAWDLSSDVFNDEICIIGGTFLGKLVEHSTSCSLYEEKSSGWVSTLCPGNACNFAWGTSGGSNKLKMIGNTRRSLRRISRK